MDESHRALFHLTVLLGRAPDGTDALAPLVRGGFINLSISLEMPGPAIAALEILLGDACHVPSVREARINLVDESRTRKVVLTDGLATGTRPVVHLSSALRRDDTIAVMHAIAGDRVELSLVGTVAMQMAGAWVPTRIRGSWPAIYESLRRRAGGSSRLTRQEVEAEFANLIETRTIVPISSEANQLSSRQLIDTLVCQSSSFLEIGPDDVFVVGNSPSPAMRLETTETTLRPSLDLYLAESLGELLQPVRSDLPPDELVTLLCVSGTGGGLQAVPSLGPSGTSSPPSRYFIMDEIDLRPLSFALSPEPPLWPGGIGPPANNWSGLGALRPGASTIDRDTVEEELPQLEVVEPQPGDDPAASSFLFSVRTTGAAAGGDGLSTGLRAEVRLTVRFLVPNDRGFTYTPGPLTPQIGVSFGGALEIPFRVKGTGETKSQRFVGTIDPRSNPRTGLTFTVNLLDDWARLAYGALAYRDFQAQPARFIVALSYPSSDSATRQEAVVLGKKTARIEIAASRVGASWPIFEPASNSLWAAEGVLQFQRARPAQTSSVGPSQETMAIAERSRASAAIVEDPESLHSTLVVRPKLRGDRAFLGRAFGGKQVPGIKVVERSVNVSLPCATYGGLYRQTNADGIERVAGCQDVLKLGEVEYRQYEELSTLRSSHYRVFRSLQQPGRFLVLPTSYRITRYGPSQPPDRAFRPVIFIYGIIDSPPAPNRYFLSATLEPDIPNYERRVLAEALLPLVPFHAVPVLDYPTDPALQAAASFRWALPAGIEIPEVAVMGNTLQVGASTGLANALALTGLIEGAGLSGQVDFTLPDGTTLTSGMRLDTQIIGPWETGPVQVILSEDTVSVHNRSEQALHVSELGIDLGTEYSRRVRADLALAAGALIDLGASMTGDLKGAEDIVPFYTSSPQSLSLAQLNIFVEDVSANILIMNLINYENNGLASIEFRAQLKSTSHDYTVVLGDGVNGEIDVTLPLTTYLERQVLEFQITKYFRSGQTVPMPWRGWDLDRQGVIISLTSAMLE